MTLEEAKKKIKAQAEAEWEEFKKSGSMLCQGFALGADDALETLDKVESSGNLDKLTLKELARELRKVFRFKYLTVSPDFCGCPMKIYCWTSIRPTYNAKGRMWIISQEGSQTIASSFEAWHLEKSLDLSEYKDADGNIDYSKCIVEVSDDIG